MPKARVKKYTKKASKSIAKPKRKPSKRAVAKARDREVMMAMGVTTRAATRRASTEGPMSTSENTSKSNNTVEMKSIGSGNSDPLSPMGFSPPPESSPPETSTAAPEDSATPGPSRVPSPHPSSVARPGQPGFTRPTLSAKRRSGAAAMRAAAQGPSSVDASAIHTDSSCEAMAISTSTEGDEDSESSSGSPKEQVTKADTLYEVDESGSDPGSEAGSDEPTSGSNSSEGADSLPEHEERAASVAELELQILMESQDEVQQSVELETEVGSPEGEPSTSGYCMSPPAVADPAKTPPRETTHKPSGLWSPTRSRLRGHGGARRSEEERASSHRAEPYISPRKIHPGSGTPPRAHHVSPQKPHGDRRFSVVEGLSAAAAAASCIERSSSTPGLMVPRVLELQAQEPRERRSSEPNAGGDDPPRMQRLSATVRSRRVSSRSEGAITMEVDAATGVLPGDRGQSRSPGYQRRVRSPGGEQSGSRDHLDDVAEKLAGAVIDPTMTASPEKSARISSEDSPARKSRHRGSGGHGGSPRKHRRKSEDEGTSGQRMEPHTPPKKPTGTSPRGHRVSPRGHCLTRRSTGVETALTELSTGAASSGARSRSSSRLHETHGSEPRTSDPQPLERPGPEPQGAAQSAPTLRRSSPLVSKRPPKPAPKSPEIPNIVVSPPDEEPEDDL